MIDSALSSAASPGITPHGGPALSGAAPKAPSAHIRALDGVRAMAILLVFCHHAFGARLLWMGVDLFFILSGFLITRILLTARQQTFRAYIGQFYARRARRILPAYLLFLVVVSLLSGVAWARHWYLYLGLMNIITWQRIPQPDAMGALWSLAVEEQFYLIWPLAVFMLDRRNLTRLAVALIIAAPLFRACSAAWFHDHWATYELLPFRMDTLAFGALLGLQWGNVSRFLREHKPLVGWATLLAWIFSLACFLWLNHRHITAYDVNPLGDSLVYDCTLLLMGSLFLFASAGYLKLFFESPLLAWMARISYSFYLFHFLILERMSSHPFLGFLLSTLAASAIWLGLEKPILEQGKRRAAARA